MIDWRDIVQDYLSIARTRQDNKLAMFKLQMSILMDIVNTDEAIQHYTSLLNDPHGQEGISDGSVLKSDVKYWEGELYAHQILLVALKDIGDGILWRTLKFDRPLLHVMSQNEAPGPTQYNQGLVNEMHSFGDLINDVDVNKFVFHCITNYARVGDMLAVRNDQTVEIVEVKSKLGGRGHQWKDRLQRQNERMINLTKFANEHRGNIDGHEVEFKYQPGTPKLKLKEMRALLQDVKANGFASRMIHPFLAVAAINLEKLNDSFKIREMKIHESVRRSKDQIYHTTSLKSIEFSPHRAPISVFPFEASDAADLLMGKLQFSFHFNFTRFFEEIEQSGWDVIDSIFIDPNRVYDSRKDGALTVKRGPLMLSLPISVFSRVMFEALNINTLISEWNELYKRRTSSSGQLSILGYAEEYRNWR